MLNADVKSYYLDSLLYFFLTHCWKYPTDSGWNLKCIDPLADLCTNIAAPWCEGFYLFVFFQGIKTRRQAVFLLLPPLLLFTFHWRIVVLLSCTSAALSVISLFNILLPAEGELSRLWRPLHWCQKSSREDFLLVENVNVNLYGKSS